MQYRQQYRGRRRRINGLWKRCHRQRFGDTINMSKLDSGYTLYRGGLSRACIGDNSLTASVGQCDASNPELEIS
jgi:hypothetical protein